MEALAQGPPPQSADGLQKQLDAPWRAYALALSSVGVALLLRAALHPSVGTALPFATFFVAVTVTAWRGGRGAALVAMVLGYVGGQYFFAPPATELSSTFSALAALPIYVGVCLVIIFCFEELRKRRRRAEENMREAQQKARALREEASQRRGIEEALKQSESRYRRLIETTHEGVWTMDAEGKTDYVNARASEILG